MSGKSKWWIPFGFLMTVSTVAAVSAVLMVIWPGEAKLVAPLFCDDEYPDPFVVSDTYSVQPGETSTNFTMYCMGPRGEHRDIGWLKPYLAVSALNVAVVTVVGVLSSSLGWLVRRGRRVPEPLTVPSSGPAPRTSAPRGPSRRPSDLPPPGVTSVSDAAPTDDVS